MSRLDNCGLRNNSIDTAHSSSGCVLDKKNSCELVVSDTTVSTPLSGWILNDANSPICRANLLVRGLMMGFDPVVAVKIMVDGAMIRSFKNHVVSIGIGREKTDDDSKINPRMSYTQIERGVHIVWCITLILFGALLALRAPDADAAFYIPGKNVSHGLYREDHHTLILQIVPSVILMISLSVCLFGHVFRLLCGRFQIGWNWVEHYLSEVGFILLAYVFVGGISAEIAAVCALAFNLVVYLHIIHESALRREHEVFTYDMYYPKNTVPKESMDAATSDRIDDDCDREACGAGGASEAGEAGEAGSAKPAVAWSDSSALWPVGPATLAVFFAPFLWIPYLRMPDSRGRTVILIHIALHFVIASLHALSSRMPSGKGRRTMDTVRYSYDIVACVCRSIACIAGIIVFTL